MGQLKFWKAQYRHLLPLHQGIQDFKDVEDVEDAEAEKGDKGKEAQKNPVNAEVGEVTALLDLFLSLFTVILSFMHSPGANYKYIFIFHIVLLQIEAHSPKKTL